MEESTDGAPGLNSTSEVLEDIAPELLRLHLMESEPSTSKTKKTKTNRTVGRRCVICGLRCPTAAAFRAHRATHDEEARTCAVCRKLFLTRKYMQRHHRSMHCDEEKPLQCDYCDKRFRFLSKKKIHERRHTREQPYKCEECGKRFSARYSYKTHLLIHADSKPFACRYCPYACRDASTRRKHEARHRGVAEAYRCRLCGVDYAKKASLKAHIAERHTQQEYRVPCLQCKATFRTRATLATHVKGVHERSLTTTCPVCNVQLSSRNNLPQHLARHAPRRLPCAAPGCRARFTNENDLMKHERSHRPPFACPVCERRFARKHRLKSHMLKRHGMPLPPAAPRAPLSCAHCTRVLSTRQGLVSHLTKDHREVYTPRCDACGEQFETGDSLRDHNATTHGLTSRSVPSHGMTSRSMASRSVTSQRPAAGASPTHSTVDIKEEIIEIDEQNLDDILEEAEVVSLHDINHATSENTDKATPEQFLKDILNDEVDIIEAQDKDGDVKNVLQAAEDKYIAVTKITRVVDSDELKRIQEIDKNIVKPVQQRKIADSSVNVLLKIGNEIDRSVKKSVKCKKKIKSDEDVMFKIDKEIKELSADEPPRRTARARRDWRPRDDSDAEFEALMQEAQTRPIVRTKKTGPTVDKIIIKKGKKTKFYIKQDKNIAKERARRKRVKAKLKQTLETMNSTDNKVDHAMKRPRKPNYVAKCKLKLNTEQCYACLKLFTSKEDLYEHCKTHYDVCNEKILKKCPLCPLVTSYSLARHMRVKHDLTFTAGFAYVTREDPKDTTYQAHVKKKVFHNEVSKDFDTVDVIPSVNNLNKLTSMQIDRRRREKKSKGIFDSRLVKKGKEWIVEQDRVELDLKDYVVPNFDIKNGDYLDALKDLHYQLKDAGKRMVFPCDKCGKVCRNLSALKAHRKSHDPKVKVRQNVRTEANRKLKEFYRNNVSSDIEFNLFKKIFRQVDKEAPEKEKVKGVKERVVKRRDRFVRKILLSRTEHLKRLQIQKSMRERLIADRDNEEIADPKLYL